MAVLFSRRVIRKIIRKEGAGTNKAHIALEHVYQLK
jgi:hypothetical protein